jgi:hypothetical protein
MPIVLKYGSLNFVEPSGHVQACAGIALPFALEAYVCSAKEIIPTFCEAQTTLSSS